MARSIEEKRLRLLTALAAMGDNVPEINQPARYHSPSDPIPTVPGWYVQWTGRADWQPMDEASAWALRAIIVADGDKVVEVR